LVDSILMKKISAFILKIGLENIKEIIYPFFQGLLLLSDQHIKSQFLDLLIALVGKNKSKGRSKLFYFLNELLKDFFLNISLKSFKFLKKMSLSMHQNLFTETIISLSE